jgi:glycosidase
VREFDIDGYRCDVAGAVPSDFWNAAIDSVETIKPVMMLAEDAQPEMHDVGFDLTYAWPYYAGLKMVWEEGVPVGSLATQVTSTLEQLPGESTRLRFTTNHDETMWDATPPQLFDGLEGAKAAFVLTTSMPGTPLVYNGQELGVADTVSFFDRTPYEWAGEDPSITSFYRDYLTFYRSSPALQEGDLEILTPDADDVLVYRRSTGDEELLLAVNVRDARVAVDLPSEYADASLEHVLTGETVDGPTLSLDGYGFRILRPQS